MGNNNCSLGMSECEQNANSPSKRKTESPCASGFLRDDNSYCTNCGPSKLQGFNIFEKECLDAHNEVRRKHGSPALFLDRKLCNVAQNVACAMINTDIKEDGASHGYGENVYMCNGFFPNAKQVVQTWYSEIKDYKFGFTNYSMKTCHVTQLLWKKSLKLGVGFSKNGPMMIVVAIYSPRGNLDGCYTENVPPTTQQTKRDRKETLIEKPCDPADINCEKKCYKPITEFTAFHHNCLSYINDCRKDHNVPDLSLSLDCCEHSLQRANYILEANTTDTLETYYGENVYMEEINYDDEFSIFTIIKKWYKEGKLYNYAEPGFNVKTANFTQMIWKNTTHMGSAFLQADGKNIFVINYVPPGNKRGQFAVNVLVPTCNQIHAGQELISTLDSSCSRHTPSASKPETPHLTHRVSDQSVYNGFQKEILKSHNEVRSLHNAEPLELDSYLCDMAKIWAENLASKNIIEHINDRNNYGENLHMSTGSEISGNNTVSIWYKESEKYNYKNPGFEPKTERFTQVVWKSTKRIGVATAQNGDVLFVVCFYFPKGNITGEYADNVIEP